MAGILDLIGNTPMVQLKNVIVNKDQSFNRAV